MRGSISPLMIVGLLTLASSPPTLARPDEKKPAPRVAPIGAHAAVPIPQGWSLAPAFYSNATELLALPEDRQHEAKLPQAGPDGMIRDWTPRITIFREQKLSHADAVARLKEIASEYSTPAIFVTIGGWPALERRHLAPLPRRGRNVEDIPTAGMAVMTTTAIAAGSEVIRMEGVIPAAAEATVVEQVQAIGRSTEIATPADPEQTERELAALRATPPRSVSLLQTAPEAGAPQAVEATAQSAPGAALQIFAGSFGELEIAASADGQDVVVARQRHAITSNNGGQTFRPPVGLPFSNRGDPSVTVAQSGDFYWAAINNTAGCGGSPLYGCATGIMRSTDRGQTFPFVTNAVTCPNAGPGACFPDQEHIAADRWNAASGNDQIYSVWRNFTVGETPTIVCSQDNAANWTAPAAIDTGYVPRVTVGQDGFVYAVYGQGGNIRVNKFSSCSAGLVQQPGFPVTATAYTGVTCPVPGLDRCNDGNILASYMLAVDETTPTRILLVYADANGGGGEHIYVRRSTDGGATWGAATQVSGGAAAVHRFMPWVSIRSGIAHVTWYDRRAVAVGGTNDQTDFYRRTIDASTLALGTETAIQVNQDPQCASGWAGGTRATTDSESCTVQPQLAGRCLDGSGNWDPGQNVCDFSSGPACPVGYTCQTSGGVPKYGDYNGNATSGGWAYSAWASATAPPGAANSGGIDLYFEAAQVGSDPDVSIGKVDTVDPVNAGGALGYVITVTNNSTTLAIGIQVTDTLTSPFAAISAAGWTCTTPLVGATGLVTCDLASLPGGTSSQITIAVTAPNIIGTVTNTANLSGSNDGTAGNNTAGPISTAVISPADVYGTKTLYSSQFLFPGAPLTYTVTLSNVSAYDQFDNPGDEFTDVVPPQLTVTGVSASSGIASNVGNTVHWNGVIPGGGSVTITINCTINAGTAGSLVSNQGTILYDADGNGSNEATRYTDDPSVGGASDPTEFQVEIPIPALGDIGTGVLIVLLAGLGVLLVRRRLG